MEGQQGGVSRSDRRRERTRAALVRAAQQLIGEGRQNAAILEITQLADVGLGSFYNHFGSREELFRAATDDALDRHGELMDRLTAELADPAEIYARSFRLTGRLIRRVPNTASVLLRSGGDFVHSDRGLAPRALRDLTAANAAGRFRLRDPRMSLMLSIGALIALGLLLEDDPGVDGDEATDGMVEDLLRSFGLDDADARKVARAPLPDLEAALGTMPAA